MMSKPAQIDEVQVLRFFETGSLEKAEVVFKIVSEKMRDRLRDSKRADAEHPAEQIRLVKRRAPAEQTPPPGLAEPSE